MTKVHAPYGPLSFFADYEPPASDFRSDVMEGLKAENRHISPKYLYDEAGAKLFDRICETPEYYLTRTEISLLTDIADDISGELGPDCAILEYGSGIGVKVETLLNALEKPKEYVALDLSRDFLLQATSRLAEERGSLSVGAICGDFFSDLDLPEEAAGANGATNVGFFPGSTIGNFEPESSRDILRNARETLGEDSAFLLGADLKKEKTILDAAYDDAEGVTAEFSLNLLRRMKRELGADVAVDDFFHDADYKEDKGRVEIFLRAKRPTQIVVEGEAFDFADGEAIHTEYAYKFERDDLEAMAAASGWRLDKMWTDKAELFATTLLKAA